MVVEEVRDAKKYFDVIVSENDPRKYRFLELENRIKILLISDDLADKSAASADVHIGKYLTLNLLFIFMHSQKNTGQGVCLFLPQQLIVFNYSF